MRNVLINHAKEVGKKTGHNPLLMPPRDDIIRVCTNFFSYSPTVSGALVPEELLFSLSFINMNLN